MIVACARPQPSPSAPPPVRFAWAKQWGAIGEARDFAGRNPQQISLYNKHYAVWQSSAGRWVAAPDRCPHAGAPLSNGTVLQDGNLQCPYHGWQFDAAGTCVRDPHLPGKGAPAANGRRNVPTLQVREHAGMLYMRPDALAAADANLFDDPPQLPSVFAEGPYTTLRRVVPGPYLQLVANALDYTHIDFAHAFGSASLAHPVAYEVVARGPLGFTARAGNEITTEFTAPGHVYHRVNRGPITVHIWSNLTPAGPNRTHHVSKIAFRLNPDAWQMLPANLREPAADWSNHLVRGVLDAMPQLPLHLFNLRTSEEDANIIPNAAHRRGQLNRSDLPRRLFEDWVERHGLPTAPTWLDNATFFTPVALQGAEPVERYHQHTKNCAVCRPAYETARSIEGTWPLASIGLLAASSVAAAHGSAATATALAVGATIGCLVGLERAAVRAMLGPPDPPEFRR